MELTHRVGAAFAALAAALMFSMAQPARAGETNPGKLQHRVETDRFAAPGLVRDASITGQQVAGAARLRRQDRLAVLPGGCRIASWSEIPWRCLFGSRLLERSRRNLRTITIETRVGPNTSVLTRVPADIAAR